MSVYLECTGSRSDRVAIGMPVSTCAAAAGGVVFHVSGHKSGQRRIARKEHASVGRSVLTRPNALHRIS